MQKLTNKKELEKLREEILSKTDPDSSCIIVSGGTCGYAKGSEKVLASIREELKNQELDRKIDIRYTGCLGFCEREPIVIIHPERFFYVNVQTKDVPEIIKETVVKGKILDKLCYVDPISGQKIIYKKDIPFYKKQLPVIFGDNSKINPTSIED